MPGTLYLVPTPIGNLGDISSRMAETLETVDFIAAEDTRVTVKLLNHLGIKKPMVSYYRHNTDTSGAAVLERLLAGENCALVTDAGTPGISDPGFLLVRTCLEHGIEVETLPGATAFVPALVNSGFPCDRFCFEGFLPPKKGRSRRLQQLADEERTMIFYESPYRLVKTLAQFAELFGPDREASVSRELTKKFEENVRGTLRELIVHFSAREVKGEIVIVLGGKPRKAKREDADNGAVDDAEENGLQED